MPDPQEYFATSAMGIESVTAAELVRIGAENVRPVTGGVHFSCGLNILYRAHLWLRTASRILRPLREFAAANPEMLYSQTRRVRWEQFLDPSKTFAVHATIAAGSGRPQRTPDDRADQPTPASGPRPRARGRTAGTAGKGGRERGAAQGITHSQYAALKVKDAIVDRLRREQGARPNVDREHPDLGVHAHFAAGRCTLSLDASGSSLHERGYRVQTTAAPLKETLAAAIVELTGWDRQAPLIDPMCGSGTIVIEAAMQALRAAPGLLRSSFAFERWPDFDGALWEVEQQAARAQRLAVSPALVQGGDRDPKALDAATANATRAGVAQAIRFVCQPAEDATAPPGGPGLIVVNPPYGNRLGDEAELKTLYRRLGEVWKQNFRGWAAWVLAGNLPLAREFHLAATQKIRLNNGPLECRLLKFDLQNELES